MGEFDRYAPEYKEVLARNLRYIPGGTDYYNRNRVQITKRLLGNTNEPNRILDFGAGIGLSIPHLKSTFPAAVITICDNSQASTDVACREHPDVAVVDSQLLPSDRFDVVFVAGVIHHVCRESSIQVLQRIIESTTLNGLAVFHELNPFNPVTRRLVANCPFDEDAILLSKRELIESLLSIEGTSIQEHGYSVFFPPILQSISTVERLLKWCPMGAQYFVAVRRVHDGS